MTFSMFQLLWWVPYKLFTNTILILLSKKASCNYAILHLHFKDTYKKLESHEYEMDAYSWIR
jgi:hypothetical protein